MAITMRGAKAKRILRALSEKELPRLNAIALLRT